MTFDEFKKQMDEARRKGYGIKSDEYYTVRNRIIREFVNGKYFDYNKHYDKMQVHINS